MRFIYAAPLSFLYLYALTYSATLPELNLQFVSFVMVGGIAQILGTLSLLNAFSIKGFGVSSAFSKTEVLQTAVFGYLLLSENLSLGGWGAIAISLLGVLLLSNKRMLTVRWDSGVWLGLGAGAGFAFSVVCYRAASLALVSPTEDDVLMRAALTLASVLCFQSILMGAYFVLYQREELLAVFCHWRKGVFVGAAGMLASVGWFTAMSMTTAALVRAVGQVEMVFVLITSVWLFKEKLSWREWVGVCLIGFAIIVLLVTDPNL